METVMAGQLVVRGAEQKTKKQKNLPAPAVFMELSSSTVSMIPFRVLTELDRFGS